MPDTSVEIAGVKLDNPLMLASGPMSNSGEKIKRVALEGSPGAIITKSISVDMGTCWGRGSRPPSPMGIWFSRTRSALNSEKGEPFTSEQWFKGQFPLALEGGVPIVGNASGHSGAKEMLYITQSLEAAGAAMIELNYGVPHGAEWEHGYEVLLSGRAARLVELIKKHVKAPVIVKFPYLFSSDTKKHARQMEEAGADAISATNAVQGTYVDVDTGRIPLALAQRAGWLSGPAIKPLGVNMVKDIASTVKIPVIGIGGVATGRDVIEYIMAGASAVQLLTMAMIQGPQIFRKINQQVRQFMEAKGYASLDEFRGIALRDLGKDWFIPHIAVVDNSVCNGCGKCEEICQWIVHSHPPAIQADREKKEAWVDEEKCLGCGWCVSVCGPKAIHLRGWPEEHLKRPPTSSH